MNIVLTELTAEIWESGNISKESSERVKNTSGQTGCEEKMNSNIMISKLSITVWRLIVWLNFDPLCLPYLSPAFQVPPRRFHFHVNDWQPASLLVFLTRSGPDLAELSPVNLVSNMLANQIEMRAK